MYTGTGLPLDSRASYSIQCTKIDSNGPKSQSNHLVRSGAATMTSEEWLRGYLQASGAYSNLSSNAPQTNIIHPTAPQTHFEVLIAFSIATPPSLYQHSIFFIIKMLFKSNLLGASLLFFSLYASASPLPEAAYESYIKAKGPPTTPNPGGVVQRIRSLDI